MNQERPSRAVRRWVLVGLTFLIFSLPFAIAAVVVSANIYILDEGLTESEDVYVAANSARVQGTIDGDLIVAAGDVTISGSVTGDVLVATQGSLVIDGEVGGSVRGLARDVDVTGVVGQDLAVAAGDIDIVGEVSRDVLLLALRLDVEGVVGRDILGRVQSADLDGSIGGDVDILVGNLTLGAGVDVAGDVVYRSNSEARVSSDSEFAGSLSRLPTRGSFIVRSALLFVTLIHFLSFVFSGLLLLWLFPSPTSRSVAIVLERPWRSLGVGVLALVLVPIVIVILVFSLVGVAVGALLLVLLLLALFFAPIPAVAAGGYRLMRGRGALFGGFVVGALLWRGLIWLIPLIAVVIYLVSVALGLGAYLLAMSERRRSAPDDMALVPVRETAVEAPAHEDWDAPLAPGVPVDDAVDEPGTDSEEDEA